RSIALAFFLGTGLMTMVMMFVPWKPAWIIIVMIVLSLLSGVPAPRRRTAAGAPPPHRDRERVSPIALITLAMLIGYARYATAALATLAMAPLIATPWIGLGDGAFIAFAVSGLLLIRLDSVLAGALLLGCSMLSKNEGYAITFAAIIALAATRGVRSALRLWPA